jgi:type I restriction enzyme S subunit
MSFTANIDDVVAENRNGLLAAHPTWQRTRLKEVAAILNGYPFESARFSKEKGTPLIRIRDILPGRTETFYIGDFDSAFLVQPGEIVVGMDGDFHCAAWSGGPALLNQRVCKITPDESRYSKLFLRYVLPGYLSAINAETPSVTVKHLSSRTVADIPLPLPPIKEQRRIVAEIEKQFTRLEAGVAALRRVQANLKRYRAAVLKAACEGCLVPSEAELAAQRSHGVQEVVGSNPASPTSPFPYRGRVQSYRKLYYKSTTRRPKSKKLNRRAAKPNFVGSRSYCGVEKGKR